jgi:hypothetical protein
MEIQASEARLPVDPLRDVRQSVNHRAYHTLPQ